MQMNNNWISVKDRMPKSGDAVLITGNGCVDYGIYSERYSRWYEINYDRYGDEIEVYYNVTHWQPLPKPPIDTLKFGWKG